MVFKINCIIHDKNVNFLGWIELCGITFYFLVSAKYYELRLMHFYTEEDLC